MYQSFVDSSGKARSGISIFGGLNQNEYCESNEFCKMENLSSGAYPYLTQRSRRAFKKNEDYFGESTVIETTFPGVHHGLYELCSEEVIIDKGEFCRVDIMVDGVLNPPDLGFSYVSPEASMITATGCCYHDGAYYFTAQGIERFLAFDTWDTTRTIDSCKITILNPGPINAGCMHNGKIALIANNALYYDGKPVVKGIGETWEVFEENAIVSYGAMLICLPSGLIYNTETEETSYIAASKKLETYTAADAAHGIFWVKEIRFTNCDFTGAELDIFSSKTEPEEPEDGQLWYNPDEEGLYKWYAPSSVWMPAATQYVRMSVHYSPTIFDAEWLSEFNEEDLFTMFEEGDGVKISGMVEPPEPFGNDTYSIIQKIGKGKETITHDGVEYEMKFDYLLFKGYIEGEKVYSPGAIVSRDLPAMKHMFSVGNRLWGCTYEMSADGETRYNELRCCKLGDPKNWNVFEGASTDSYTASVGDPGEFTAGIEYNGYPFFFKENCIYTVYGSYPASYQVKKYSCPGVQKGSAKSAVISNGYLYYKSETNFCAFSSEFPQNISYKLKKKYSDVVSGATGSKIYHSCMDESGNTELLVYDSDQGLWYRESGDRVYQFCTDQSGRMFGVAEEGLIDFGETTTLETEKEGPLSWYAETGLLGLDSPDQKTVNRYTIRMKMEEGANMTLLVAYDDGEFEPIFHCIGEGRLVSQSFSVRPVRCDHLRLRLEGEGRCTVYSIAYTSEQRSDKA